MFDDISHRRDSPRVTEIILGEQPATQHEETRKTEEDENRVIAHSGVSQAEMTDMRKNHENHRESPHRIDVCYSLFRHSTTKVQFFFQYLG
jgi:hypothetical protein